MRREPEPELGRSSSTSPTGDSPRSGKSEFSLKKAITFSAVRNQSETESEQNCNNKMLYLLHLVLTTVELFRKNTKSDLHFMSYRDRE